LASANITRVLSEMREGGPLLCCGKEDGGVFSARIELGVGPRGHPKGLQKERGVLIFLDGKFSYCMKEE